MENCKNEFIEHTSAVQAGVICAEVVNGTEYGDIQKPYILPLGYSPNVYEAFLSALDFQYDAGYGGQELFGTIWYADGTWSSRGEYDGSEWWEHNKSPEIPQRLKGAAPHA